MFVKVPKILFNLRPQLDSKQKLFLSNMLGIGGGAVIFTLWQIMIPLSDNIPEYGLLKRSVIIVLAGILFIVALMLQKEEK